MADGGSPSWPAVSVPEMYRILTAPGMPFEMEEKTIEGLRLRVYKNAPKSLFEIFKLGHGWGRREFIVYENDRQTYDEHFRAATALGKALKEKYGVRKGDRMVIAMRNLPEWSLAFWAGVSIGAVVAPLNAWGLGPELAFAIQDCGAKVAIVDAERFDRLEPHLSELNLAGLVVVRGEARPPAVTLESLIGAARDYATLPGDLPDDPGLEPEDDATIFYTSGTTGRPKGALGTHRNIMSNLVTLGFSPARAAIRRGEPLPTPDPNAPQKVGLLAVPLFHVTGCHSTLVPMVAAGSKLVLMHKWSPERWLELVEKEKVTGSGGVPSMAWQVFEHPDFHRRDISSLESYGYGGAAAAPELTQKFAKLLPHIPPGQGYGATETSSVSTANSAEDYMNRPDSVGLAVPVVDLKVVDTDGNEVPRGQPGELWIRGPNVVKGYWNNPEASAKSFTDGWYHTGDIVRMDEEGFVFILDRAKDMLIRGGENIYCVEIEDALLSHPAVIDAAVVGLPHRILGEEVGAVVQLKTGEHATEDHLIEHVGKLLPKHKTPVRIDVRREEFPRNASGKTLKPKLREEMLASHGKG